MSKKSMTTIKNKMFGYTFAIIILMAVLSIFSMTITNVYKSRIDEMFVRNLELDEVGSYMKIIDEELLVYLSTKSSTSLNNYMRNSDSARKVIDSMVEGIHGYNDEELMLIDIKEMMGNYLAIADQAISDKRKSNVTSSNKNYIEANRIKSYIDGYINELNIRQLDRNSESYIHMTEQVRISNLLNIVLLIDLVLLSVIIIFRMSGSIITPIVSLSHSAGEIAKGDFETEEIIVRTGDELEILARAFNKMKRSIHEYIEELKEKALTEAKLMEQELENLKMQSLLDSARLYALQSQMNPHFLFNTINAGVQLSMLEGADRTSEFLETMSRLFRYNIKQLSQAVTLRQEVENIRDYHELLKVRFGDLIQFQFIIDDKGLSYMIPPLTLQPIVENAYLHGLASKEDGGRIKVTVHHGGTHLMVSIEDDGVGMPHSAIDRIRQRVKEDQQHPEEIHKSSNGIGMANVIERLELFYGQKDLMSIRSKMSVGTKVMMTLPLIPETPDGLVDGSEQLKDERTGEGVDNG